MLSGNMIASKGVVTPVDGSKLTISPNGVDLSIQEIAIERWNGRPVDLSNVEEVKSVAQSLFETNRNTGNITLTKGAYPVKMREVINLSQNQVGFAWTRSSLIRLGNHVAGGVFDAGYRGIPTLLLVVNTPLVLKRGDRIAQFVVYEADEELGTYSGSYQNEGLSDFPV